MKYLIFGKNITKNGFLYYIKNNSQLWMIYKGLIVHMIVISR